jgi:hypothetical protein
MSIKQNLLLISNKIVMKTPLLSFDIKVKIRRKIMSELKCSGFKGI